VIEAGALRHRLSIEHLVAGSPTQDAGGEVDQAWVELAEVWGSIEPLRGRELIAAQQAQSETTGTIRIRYRAGITSKMRVVFRARIFEILGVVNPMERNVELVLSVREGPSNG